MVDNSNSGTVGQTGASGQTLAIPSGGGSKRKESGKKKKCPPGFELDPITNRCVKIEVGSEAKKEKKPITENDEAIAKEKRLRELGATQAQIQRQRDIEAGLRTQQDVEVSLLEKQRRADVKAAHAKAKREGGSFAPNGVIRDTKTGLIKQVFDEAGKPLLTEQTTQEEARRIAQETIPGEEFKETDFTTEFRRDFEEDVGIKRDLDRVEFPEEGFKSPTEEAVEAGNIGLDGDRDIKGLSEEGRKAVLLNQIGSDSELIITTMTEGPQKLEVKQEPVLQAVAPAVVGLGAKALPAAGRFLSGSAKLVTAGAIGSAIGAFVTKPISLIFDFDRKAKALNAGIPDLREQVSIVVGNAKIGAYSPYSETNYDIARQTLDSIEEQVNSIQENMQIEIDKSPSIRKSGELPGMIARLDKFKGQIIGARQRLFLDEQQGITGLSEEELLRLIEDIQK